MNSELIPEVELSEGLRWCFRHSVCVDFYGDGDRHYIRFSVPKRGTANTAGVKGSLERFAVAVPHHDRVGETFVETIAALRKRLGYE